jgi:hypothetical protein
MVLIREGFLKRHPFTGCMERCRRFEMTSLNNKCDSSKSNIHVVNTLFALPKYATRREYGHVGEKQQWGLDPEAPVISPKIGCAHRGICYSNPFSDKNFGASPHPHKLGQLKF